jgi:transposase
MKEGDIVMSKKDQLRVRVLLDLEGDRMTRLEAASALGITPRQLSTLRGRLRLEGASGVCHRSRGRVPVNASEPKVADLVLSLWKTKYEGFNQAFFTEMLEREEGILLSRSTVRRLLERNNIPAAKPQKRSRHRRHRVRRAQEGAMIQMDGSHHKWLGDRGPRITLVGGIDDATNRVWAVFRNEEDLVGYFTLLHDIVSAHGIPGSIYTDKTTIFLNKKRTPERVRAGTTSIPTHLTRVLERLDIVLIQARSPQAKGRVERLWRTLQDRLLCELRAKNVKTLAHAQQVLKDHLSFHNRNFGLDALDPLPA